MIPFLIRSQHTRTLSRRSNGWRHGSPLTILNCWRSGVIDWLYRNSNGWHLIDYKTDRVPLAALCELYGDQIRHYPQHWAAVSKAPLVYAGIYSTQLGMRAQDLHHNKGV